MDPTGLPLSKAEENMSGQARLPQLRQFVFDSSLTRDELRYMKILLSRVHIDIIGELPIELVRRIAQLLDLDHFVACLAVSRRWRDKFLSAPVICAVLNKFSSLGQAAGSTQISPDECLKALHRIGRARWNFSQSSLRKEYSWVHEAYFIPDPDYHGDYEDMSIVYAQFSRPGDPDRNNPNPYASEFAMYSNGKIAWLARPHIVVVDNLWSRTRKIFNVPAGPLIGPVLELLALGDRLVVSAIDRLLIAWDHVTNVCLEKKLPGSIKLASTEGSRVAVLLFSGDVLLWDFGGRLSTLTITPPMNSYGPDTKSSGTWASNLRAIFLPGCSKTLFLASCYTCQVNSGTITKQTIYEFDDTNHKDTFENEISPKIYENRTDRAVISEAEIRKLLPYCRDTIGFLEKYRSPDPSPLSYAAAYVGFDMYDRKFSATTNLRYNQHIPGWHDPLEDTYTDLDFHVRFYDGRNSFSVHSFQPGFDFKTIG
ncbi:hypothetical protein F5Y13DRAFT_113280 [Hypoxylon sp. FL1857]|nr:hypothetical protein F5Y13DRAFT_113280 [Hypoxylon sp. FL1857]